MKEIMRADILKYYENLKIYYGTYHNHKEISAWAGLVLYIVVLGAINSILIQSPIDLPTAIIVTSMLLIILYLVFRYISIQLEMKSMADNYSAAASSVISEIIIKNIIDDNELINYVRIEESSDKKVKSSHFLPKHLIEMSKKTELKGNKLKNRIKHMIYGILLIVTLFALIRIWS
jgi:hypothetical protein